jgi:hypothetical protein
LEHCPKGATIRGYHFDAGIAMEIAFKQFNLPAPPAPAAGELHVRQASAELRYRRKLALLALEHGPGGFVCQEPSIRKANGRTDHSERAGRLINRVVVQADPTLDDMLAATFLVQSLAGKTLPPAARIFAEYAAIARQGLKPGDVPLEESLAGLYLAIRNQAGDDLTQPDARSQFLTGWFRLERRILQALEENADPLTTSLFKGNSEFALARTYLTNSRKVYYQQDIPRGERWLVQVPGGPPEAGGLVLRNPHSILWKYWAREDTEAPGGKGYLFLGVWEEEKKWVFSTDPVFRLPIKSLADELQKAEMAKGTAKATNDPWYNGNQHGYTLVGAPRDGTALSDAEVLQVVGRWCRARVIREPKTRPIRPAAAVGVAVGILVVALSTLFIFKYWPSQEDERGIEFVITDPEAAVAGDARKGKDYALIFASDKYQYWGNLDHPVQDAKKVKQILEEKYNFAVKLLKNPRREEILETLRESHLRKYDDDDQMLIFFAGHGCYDEATQRGFVVGSNSLKTELTRSTCVSHSDLRDDIETIGCKHIFVVMDICFGGSFDFAVATSKKRGPGETREISKSQFIRRKLKYKTRRYLTSGGLQSVPDKSPFAQRFIDALQTGDGDEKILTINKIVDKVEKLEPEPRHGHFGGNEANSDFLFIAKQR